MHLTRKLTVALAAALALAGLASPAAAADGACTEPDGVTVVVDLTDLGGAVEIGCAAAPATGTEALQQAGFADTRDASGLICAIDAQPDPCPAEFTGSYWSYWFAEPGGEWQTYMEGSDTAVPAPGAVEGWRYFDGSAGPTVEAATVVPAVATDVTTQTSAEPSAEATAEPSAEATAADTASADSSSGVLGWVLGALGAAAAGAAAVVLVRRRRAGV